MNKDLSMAEILLRLAALEHLLIRKEVFNTQEYVLIMQEITDKVATQLNSESKKENN